MAAQKSLLSMGIAVPPKLQERLDACKKEVVDAGYDFDMIQFDPANFSSEQQRIIERLRSKHWDGVLVGFGVRGNPKLTDVFETLVNTVGEALPGVKLGFPSSPDDVLPCVVRNFGEKE